MQQSPLKTSGNDRIQVVDSDLEKYCAAAIEAGATHAKQVHPTSVVTAPWVLLKCQFGCFGYDRGHCCPPRTWTFDRTREILDSYDRAILVHIELPDMPDREQRNKKFLDAMVELEGRLFKDGFYKAFVFLAGPCKQCEKCAALDDKPCNIPMKARPSMEACGMDVYQTARNNGFFIRTLSERTETNNKYCLMLVD